REEPPSLHYRLERVTKYRRALQERNVSYDKDFTCNHLLNRCNQSAVYPKLRTPPRPRPGKFRYFTISITEQSNCGTIGLFSLQRRPTDRGRGSKLRNLD